MGRWMGRWGSDVSDDVCGCVDGCVWIGETMMEAGSMKGYVEVRGDNSTRRELGGCESRGWH
jgi:hypothetical protein